MPHFGFDLDNTLIDYSESCQIYADLQGFDKVNTLTELRNLLKPLDYNSESWTKAQSWIYGEGLKYAKLSTDVVEFLNKLKERRWSISIHSHKTRIGPLRFGEVRFQDLMNRWIKDSLLPSYVDINSNLFFYTSLELKVLGIQKVNLTHYVDDLPKVFASPNFPRHLRSYLYRSRAPELDWVKTIATFKEIEID